MKELNTIQTQLNAPKNQRNNFGGYNYRSCEDILEALKPLLKETGCVLTLSDSIVEIGGRIYVEAVATIKNEKGEAVSVSAYAREEESKKGMDASQITGATSSYARKYALNGLFCIDDNKDADATNTHGKSASLTPDQAAAQGQYDKAIISDSLQYKPLSKEAYEKLIAAYSAGKKTNDGQDLRRWFCKTTHAGNEELAQFDNDVHDYKAKHNIQ
jgi:hypothetical protein